MRKKINVAELDSTYTDLMPLEKIDVQSRIRKDLGDIEALAADIKKHGMLNPLTVLFNSTMGEGFPLIAGQRRYEAAKLLGWTEVLCRVVTTDDAQQILEMEIAENEMRKDFTVSERLDFAARLKAVEAEKARERKGLYAREGRDENQDGADRSYPEKGRAEVHIAEKAGFSSRTQYRRAEALAEKRPDLLAEVDAGRMSLTGAEAQMKRDEQPITAKPAQEPPKPISRNELERKLRQAEKRIEELEADIKELKTENAKLRKEIDERSK